MRELVKINRKTCRKCKYHMLFGSNGTMVCCNYLTIEGRSRVYEDGEAQYDPKFCDKFTEGEKIVPRVDTVNFSSQGYDEFIDYKVKKIRKEQSRYDYKHR